MKSKNKSQSIKKMPESLLMTFHRMGMGVYETGIWASTVIKYDHTLFLNLPLKIGSSLQRSVLSSLILHFAE